MGKFPKNWSDFTPVGEQLPCTPFLPFKTPLDSSYFRQRTSLDPWTPEMLLQRFPNLSVIIDLTDTTRYYRHQDVSPVPVVKIQTEGRKVPDEAVVNEFFRVVDSVIQHHGRDQALIGVHCTHGVSRTGYLICKYLKERYHWPVDQALRLFAESRGYPIKRFNYRQALFRRK